MTTFNPNRIRQFLRAFDFESLFEELGWEQYSTRLEVLVDNQPFTLQAVAEKRNVVALTCPLTEANAQQPQRRKIERQVARTFQEHIIIYVDAAHTRQIWQWVRREPGKPLATREQPYQANQSGELLLQKLQAIAFSLAEEEGLTLVDVTSRVRAAFNVERATKKFYDHFKKERDAFEKFLEGVPDRDLARWYVSVMLNRLMFIYFIQKKGFLDGDPDYLRHKLTQQSWQNRFYRDFLCPLFFEGFAQAEHSPPVKKLLGTVPYLNGGIFQQHEVERRHGQTIQIPDAAFARLFNFFDGYQWHLDDRPLRDDREINPDVLGYIFEKYINQKQMGAYYTKEDITEYISKNTILPFLFDQARQGCRVVFEEEPSVWDLLATDPDRYIYPAVGHGAELPLPAEIAAGLDEVSHRGQWNTPTPEEYGLPTEIWRETVARRQRYEAVRAKLTAGQVRDINDLITDNLDIQQFAQDVIEQSEGPELLRAFWQALNKVSILDPTAGSGAFLFAALNILEPLYEACLERMAGFVAELPPEAHPQKFSDFKTILDRVGQHPNRRYFVYKSIMINNLYGVDLMEEAVEIAKLRLFLKLAAQVERDSKAPNQGIEPLPDIDFNIRAGNTLVGFATREEVGQAMASKQLGGGVTQGKLMFGEEADSLARIEAMAGDIDRLFQRFRQQQTDLGGQVDPGSKAELRRRLAELEEELNRALALQYGVNPGQAKAYEKWRKSHQPFHWFIEFYGILQDGGFDVIIGNPPYVEYDKKIKSQYTIYDYETEPCRNLYAFVLERCFILNRTFGHCGVIIPVSSIGKSSRTATLRNLMFEREAYFSSYAGDTNPGILFEGVKRQLAICLLRNTPGQLYITRYHRWYADERNFLFHSLHYTLVNQESQLDTIPKLENALQTQITEKILKKSQTPQIFSGVSEIYFHRAFIYWLKSYSFKPYFNNERDGSDISTHHMRILPVRDDNYANVIVAILNSTTYYLFTLEFSDCRNIVKADVTDFHFGFKNMGREIFENLIVLGGKLMQDFDDKSAIQTIESSRTGKVQYQQFYIKFSKPIIDEIDRLLAQHYGFTDEELDFIINYDIKYRMGAELLDDEEGED